MQIATTLLSLEILASSFAGWSALHPQAAARAHTILKRIAHSPQMPLMEFYLYPPKHISAAAVAALAPPASREASEAELDRASKPELVGGKMTPNRVRQERPAIAAPEIDDIKVGVEFLVAFGLTAAVFLASKHRPAGPGPDRTIGPAA